MDWLSRPAADDARSWTSRLLVLRVGKDKVGTAQSIFSVISWSERRIDVFLSFFYGNVRWIRLAKAGSLQVSYMYLIVK